MILPVGKSLFSCDCAVTFHQPLATHGIDDTMSHEHYLITFPHVSVTTVPTYIRVRPSDLDHIMLWGPTCSQEQPWDTILSFVEWNSRELALWLHGRKSCLVIASY